MVSVKMIAQKVQKEKRANISNILMHFENATAECTIHLCSISDTWKNI